MTKEEVIKELLTGLTEECLFYSLRRCKDEYLKEEMRGYLWEVILTTPEEKIVSVYENHHCNSWITQIIRRSFWSKNSPFYKRYHKQQDREVDIEEASNLSSDYME